MPRRRKPATGPHLTGPQLFNEAVDTHEMDDFARSMGMSRSYCEKVMYEPAADGMIGGTNVVNPIILTDRFFEWCLMHQPEIAHLLADRYAQKLEAHLNKLTNRPPASQAELEENILEIFTETGEFQGSIALNAPSAVVRKELADVVAQVEKFLTARDSRNQPTGLRQVG